MSPVACIRHTPVLPCTKEYEKGQCVEGEEVKLRVGGIKDLIAVVNSAQTVQSYKNTETNSSLVVKDTSRFLWEPD